MGFLKNLTEWGNKIYTPVNKFGSEVYGNLNKAYNSLDRAVHGTLPYGEPVKVNKKKVSPMPTGRMAGPPTKALLDGKYGNVVPVDNDPRIIQTPITDKQIYETVDRMEARNTRGSERYSLADRKNPITKYIDEIPDKGAYPVLLSGLTPETEAVATAIKSRLGDLGKPFRILRSPGTSEQLQRQVEGATIVDDNNIKFNPNSPNWEKDRFATNLQGHGIVGQFYGEVKPDNTVVAKDDAYDTHSLDWHLKQLKDRYRSGDTSGVIESGLMNVPFAALDPWANKYPRGRNPVIGKLSPDHPLYKPQ